MRCSKCGYENVNGTVCVKCGTPLQNNGYRKDRLSYCSGSVEPELCATQIMNAPPVKGEQLKSTVIQGDISKLQDSQLKSTILQNIPNNKEALDTCLKSTVVQKDVKLFLENDSEQMACPKCGYPIAASFNNCPNCGADFYVEEKPTPSVPLQAASIQTEMRDEQKVKNATVDVSMGEENYDGDIEINSTCDQCHAKVPVEFSFCPHCGAKIVLKTIPSIHHNNKINSSIDTNKTQTEKICYLTLVPEKDEQIEPTPKTYKGTSIVLNRENTEASNRTITSKEQAILTFENGNWFIENRSEFDSTLIVVNRKKELSSGDIIVLGDRRFKFEDE